MSYFSITDFIKSGQESLEAKNYQSALSLALALPSMCARVMFYSDDFKGINQSDKNGYQYINKKGKRCWNDKKCYVDFCKAVMRHNPSSSDFIGPYNSQLICVLGQNFADLLYQLRCDIIHAGVSNIFEDDKGIYLALGEQCGSTEFSKYRLISVHGLCNTIFNHVSSQCASSNIDNFKYTYVFDMDNSSDDKILYNRLCIDDRADYLTEEFIKENEQHKELNK